MYRQNALICSSYSECAGIVLLGRDLRFLLHPISRIWLYRNLGILSDTFQCNYVFTPSEHVALCAVSSSRGHNFFFWYYCSTSLGSILTVPKRLAYFFPSLLIHFQQKHQMQQLHGGAAIVLLGMSPYALNKFYVLAEGLVLSYLNLTFCAPCSRLQKC